MQYSRSVDPVSRSRSRSLSRSLSLSGPGTGWSEPGLPAAAALGLPELCPVGRDTGAGRGLQPWRHGGDGGSAAVGCHLVRCAPADYPAPGRKRALAAVSGLLARTDCVASGLNPRQVHPRSMRGTGQDTYGPGAARRRAVPLTRPAGWPLPGHIRSPAGADSTTANTVAGVPDATGHSRCRRPGPGNLDTTRHSRLRVGQPRL